ncbi:hypothetical protein QTP88_027272 [Uroleucon formosanum]
MYNIFKKYDPFIERYQTKTWIPTNNTQLNTPNKDTIFKINNNDNFLDIKRTKFYINGRYLQKDGKEYPKDSKIQLIDNPIPSLFSKVVVKIRGKTINEIEYVGRVSTIKGVISYSLDLNGPTINSGFVSNFKGGGTFCALGNISQLGLPFFKDYPYPLFNCDIEICFTRNTDDDALLKKDIAGTADGKIIIDEFTIKTQIIEYNPLQKVILINELNKISLEKMYTINCKAWQCIEERNITGKTIKINLSNQYRSEKHPVFCGFVFQTNKLNTQDHDPAEFDHCKLRNYRFEINGISYPAERQDEDFNNNKFCQSYEDSMVYKLTYHKNTQELPLMYDDPIDFKNYRSIFLTKTAYHPINISANKKNIILHIELHEDIPKDTICYIFFIREDEFLFDMEKVSVKTDQQNSISNTNEILWLVLSHFFESVHTYLNIQLTMEIVIQLPESNECEPGKLYRKSSYVNVHEGLQSLRNNEVFCDIKLKTEDNKIINAHKVVLSAASPYFNAMFTHFAEKNHELVLMRQIDSAALQLLVDFIYSGDIIVTKKNVQDLLAAANILQLQEVKKACCDFLQSQLCPTNCISINAIADFYSCMKLIKNSELYIYQHFSEVFGGDEFLALSSEQVIKLISSDKLVVPSEEKVFESVIRWVKYELGSRKSILPQLMEHVRLALTSKNYILKNVAEDPLIRNCLKCNHYVNEALNSLLLKEHLPQSIWDKPRHGDKVILVVGGMQTGLSSSAEYYDPKTNQWHFGPSSIKDRRRHGVVAINNNLIFDVGGYVSSLTAYPSVDVLDLSSETPCWKPGVDMLVKRSDLGVGVINDKIYAVGGFNRIDSFLSSAEVFDHKIQEWQMISNMTTKRSNFSVGVLNDLLYVVGGHNQSSLTTNTVEYYNPITDMWTPIANMCEGRNFSGVGALYGELYVVGGCNISMFLKSVEKYTPSTGVWTTIADMHLPRKNPGVVTLDGLLYAVGGRNETGILDSLEFYNPHTNTWTMVTATMIDKRILQGVVFESVHTYLNIQLTMEIVIQLPESNECEPGKLYRKSSYVNVHEGLQSLRNNEVFCDIKLKTEDNKIINAHKVVLSAASPYFNAMFTHFAEKNHELVLMRQIDSAALQLLVDFIYSGDIIVTKKNVQDLLAAANILQLQEVKKACCDFLQSQLCPTNCISINAIADFYSCMKLIKNSELYIYQHFSEVFGGDEFLALSSEQVIKLISSDKLVVPSEEKVFESVIRWVKYELGSRKSILPQLMEHVRLALTSKNYILKNVAEDPLIRNCLKCNHYVNEALNSLLLKEHLPQSIWDKPRHGDKVILVVGGMQTGLSSSAEYYDPKTNQWHFGPSSIKDRRRHGVVAINNNLIFDVGGYVSSLTAYPSVDVLDLSSETPCWKPGVDMLVKRSDLGVGVINDKIYAVGGFNRIDSFLSSAEVFDHKIQEWQMISNMTTKRSNFSVGVLNDLLYVVGGHNHSSLNTNTVEYYNPITDMWTPIANMCEGRNFSGVGALYGELYVVGGCNISMFLKSVEKYTPSTGVWTTIADMHLPRKNPVVTLDGLLYAVGGRNETGILDSLEFYNPHTNTWTMVTATMIDKRILQGVVAINRPLHFPTNQCV